MSEICHVCGQPLDELYYVSCVACGRRVHFRSSENSDDIDCAYIVSQVNVCGLAFICNSCHKQASSR